MSSEKTPHPIKEPVGPSMAEYLENKKNGSFAYESSTDFQIRYSLQQDDVTDHIINLAMANDRDYLSALAVKYAVRRMIPYGRWICADGRIVTFNREYQPMYQRHNGEDVFLKHSDYIDDIAKVEYFYADHNSPVRYALRKFNGWKMNAQSAKHCKRSMIICLKIIREFEPKRKDEYYQNPTKTGRSWQPLHIGY